MRVVPRPLLRGTDAVHRQDADVRVVASVEWGGVDYSDQKYLVGGRLAGMVIVGIFTFTIGAFIWRAIQSPYSHIFTLHGRARIVVQAIPGGGEPAPAGLRSAVRPARGVGEGEAKIVIDALSDSGYTNFMKVPEKKK
jgi:hypothetical protein